MKINFIILNMPKIVVTRIYSKESIFEFCTNFDKMVFKAIQYKGIMNELRSIKNISDRKLTWL
jgi:hypothetical protein